MRMRKKGNLKPRMERCSPVLVDNPVLNYGCWLEKYPEKKELWLELGCGKGRFTAEIALQSPQALIVAVEKSPDAMVVAMERVWDRTIENVRFIDADALALPVIFSENEVNCIFINFCDPWPKPHDARRRLTSPGFLEIYKSILKPGGKVFFKTDNNPLFEYSLRAFTSEGWRVTQVTRDLHCDGPVGVMTDYELRFFGQGTKINRLEAEKEDRS